MSITRLAEFGDYDGKFKPYHQKSPPAERPFIAWDGEGINIHGPYRKQSYVLFGCSTGERILKDRHIPTEELLDFIISVGRRNPGAHHVGFAFNYDSNMLVSTLSESLLKRLHEKGFCHFSDMGRKYYIEFRPGKWFRVSREDEEGRWSVKIEDLFSYFGTSFVDAYSKLIGPVPDVVLAGKADRATFTIDELEKVDTYWRAEIGLVRQLADALRTNLYDAGLFVSAWYGPGALASYALKREGIAEHMSECPQEVRDASRFAYAGGRFELFTVGRASVRSGIFAVDINSAYPYAISQLPSLREGVWRPVSGPPDSPTAFSIHKVRVHPTADGSFFREPGPLFHRDQMGRISYPWKLEGWYWAPEVWECRNDPRVEILEGYTWDATTRVLPFEWVHEMYAQRIAWKQLGISSEWALKLLLNSLYGKMAQRVGWTLENGRIPKWHQLEWAGWVTSLTRATLYRTLRGLDLSQIISVETDAIYTTDSTVLNAVSIGTGLGEWGVDVYDEIIYVQSGLAWLRKGDTWTSKRRGLDRDSFTLEQCEEYVRSLAPRSRWLPYEGHTTRFIGLGAAIASGAPTKVRHCTWSTTTREISVGDIGKRFHHPGSCGACARGESAYHGMHDMFIRSNAFRDRHSFPHDIPWLGDAPFAWRSWNDEELGEDCAYL